MATRHARCLRCGLRLEFDAVAGEEVSCGNCGARAVVRGPKVRVSGEDPLVGRRLGEFEIVELLGRGGMGAVYKAVRAGTHRVVALKLLGKGADAEAMARLRREAHAAAAVRDPHIVEVLGSGTLEGRPFLAMEYVDGGSLEERIEREGYLGPGEAVRLMRQVAHALAKAHAVGLMHRDIKPSNILLTTAGDAKLADFGLAKRPGAWNPRAPRMGTPHYMSPEQALGRPLDARTDLYSLGATFYHALAGRAPFRGNSETGVLAEQVDGEPLPLEAARPDLPRELCWVIGHLLKKRPEGRFQSAAELDAALDAVQAGLPQYETELTSIVPAVMPPRARRRDRAAAWLAGAGLVLALAGLLWRASQPRPAEGGPEPPRRIAEATTP